MMIQCSECNGTGRIPETDLYLEHDCSSCKGLGTRPSNRDIRKAEQAARREKYQQDLAAPIVTIKLSLPMFERELYNHEYCMPWEIVRALEKYVVK